MTRSQYPLNDFEFEETVIKEVKGSPPNIVIRRADGWDFCLPAESKMPEVGQVARFYGKGMGYIVRGLYIDGKKIFYRTAEQDITHQKNSLYGRDNNDYLKRWDAGQSVWSIEMGGLGPGYEQAIQVTFVEILRHMISSNYDTDKWDDEPSWNKNRKAIEDWSFSNPIVKKLGLSGAQWGAALSLACYFYRQGPIGVMTDSKVVDRKIQISKHFPNGG